MKKSLIATFLICSVILGSGSYQFNTGGSGSGGGITDINSDTASSQTLAVGTSGSDFAVATSGGTHTFNLPTASGTNRGALSSANWTTFNSKIGGSTGSTDNAVITADGTGGATTQSQTEVTIADNGTLTLAPSGSGATGVVLDMTGMTGSTTGIQLTGGVVGDYGIRTNLTAKSSGTHSGYGNYILINGGASGSGYQIGTAVTVGITNTAKSLAIFNVGNGNIASQAIANQGSTSGGSYAFAGRGTGGNQNVGGYFIADNGTGASANSYGVRALATNQTDSGTGQAVAVYGKINSATGQTFEESNPGITAAAVFDNGNIAGHILSLKDNGLGVITVADGGSLQLESPLVFVPSNVDLLADNQVVVVNTRSHIRLSSDNSTATARTIVLGDGVADGQVLTLEWNESAATGAGELPEAGSQVNLVSTTTWTPDNGDIIRLTWNAGASEWRELGRVDN